jgi:hypothetical protein
VICGRRVTSIPLGRRRSPSPRIQEVGDVAILLRAGYCACLTLNLLSGLENFGAINIFATKAAPRVPYVLRLRPATFYVAGRPIRPASRPGRRVAAPTPADRDRSRDRHALKSLAHPNHRNPGTSEPLDLNSYHQWSKPSAWLIRNHAIDHGGALP